MSDSLWPHGLQHTRLPCSSPSPGVCSNSCPLNWWCQTLNNPKINTQRYVCSSWGFWQSDGRSLWTFPAGRGSQGCWVQRLKPVIDGSAATAQTWGLLGKSDALLRTVTVAARQGCVPASMWVAIPLTLLQSWLFTSFHCTRRGCALFSHIFTGSSYWSTWPQDIYNHGPYCFHYSFFCIVYEAVKTAEMLACSSAQGPDRQKHT